MAWKPKNIQEFAADSEQLTLNELAVKYADQGASRDKVDKFRTRLKVYGLAMVLSEEGGQVKTAPEDPAKKATGAPDRTDLYTDGGNTWALNMKGTKIQTLEQLLEACKIDTDVWAVDTFECKAWNMAAKVEEAQVVETEKGRKVRMVTDSRIETEQLFAVSAKFKKRQRVAETKEVIEALFSGAAAHAPNYTPFERPLIVGKRLLELSIPDLHLGKLSWKPESGANYDTKIARALYEMAVENLLGRAVKLAPISKILLVVGNDLFNVDSESNMTFGGTPQDVDVRHQKSFQVGCEMMVETIERLMAVADVEVLCVPGNHDRSTVHYLGCFLTAWFRNTDQCVIQNSPSLRKYYKFGQVLLMYTHGSEEKIADLPLIMATERKHDWADSRFRFIKLGHFHKRRTSSRIDVDEEHGVQTQIMPSLCTQDAWHAQRGYVGNMQRAEAHIYHAVDGLESYLTFYAPVDDAA